jgi:hypothetical protein
MTTGLTRVSIVGPRGSPDAYGILATGGQTALEISCPMMSKLNVWTLWTVVLPAVADKTDVVALFIPWVLRRTTIRQNRSMTRPVMI